MSDARSFLKFLKSQPHDELARGVFADWLDENHEPTAAAWLRCESDFHARYPDDLPWHHPTLERFPELCANLPPDWFAAAGWYRWTMFRYLLQTGVVRTSVVVRELLSRSGGVHLISPDPTADDAYMLSLGKTGLVLTFAARNDDQRLRRVQFRETWQGTLPGRFHFQSTREEVVACFGPPDAGKVLNPWVGRYPARGIEFRYKYAKYPSDEVIVNEVSLWEANDRTPDYQFARRADAEAEPADDPEAWHADYEAYRSAEQPRAR